MSAVFGRLLSHCSCWLLCAAIAGCSSGARVVSVPLDRTQENLLYIGQAYVRYLTEKKTPPANVEQLKPYLKQVGNPDEILRSPRDGEPYNICWGVDLSKPPTWAKEKSTPVIAYERRGSGGQRYVLTTMRNAMPLSDEEFKQASFPPGHQPPNG